jgi:hypothetical protein
MGNKWVPHLLYEPGANLPITLTVCVHAKAFGYTAAVITIYGHNYHIWTYNLDSTPSTGIWVYSGSV